MQKFSQETTGFAALTIVEFMLQECVIKGAFSEEDARRILRSAARRHEDAAEGNLDAVEMNMEAARLIRSLSAGLQPLFKKQKKQHKKRKKSKKTVQKQIEKITSTP